jgi:hypothetical protein
MEFRVAEHAKELIREARRHGDSAAVDIVSPAAEVLGPLAPDYL